MCVCVCVCACVWNADRYDITAFLLEVKADIPHTLPFQISTRSLLGRTFSCRSEMSNSTPYGVKSLLECMSRATLLAQPDDVPKFLSTHVDEMIHFRDEESRDTKEVAFQFQDQWENKFFGKEKKRTKTPKTAPEDSPSPTPSVSSTSSGSFVVSPPCEVRQRSRRVSSVRVPGQDESVGLTAVGKSTASRLRPVPPTFKWSIEARQASSARVPSRHNSIGLSVVKTCPSTTPRPVLAPCKEQVKTRPGLSVKDPSEKETKWALPSAQAELPPIPQKASPQQVQGRKSTKKRGSRTFICRLNDCPYHKKPQEEGAVDRDLETAEISTKPTAKSEAGQQKSLAVSKTFDLQLPYRPKGGFIIDPELAPKPTKRVTHKTTGAESSLSKDTNSTDLSQVSLECYMHASHTSTSNVARSVHTMRYRCGYAQGGELQPHSVGFCDITLQAESQHQYPAKNSAAGDPITKSSAMGSN
uniref:uncharacterized protein LOC124052079 n=1 Tax=Scatophagus argus TaxID=75038 RepID=UPI001ED80C57|nr:uncharacterized protein LOC124052079 [Scatophagus argus]